MRQHEWMKGKSGREIRDTLKEAREAKEQDDSEESSEGTEIAAEDSAADTDGSDDTKRQAESRSDRTERVMERFADDETVAEKLRTLTARQQRLPLDVEEADDADSERTTRAGETREELVQRLLDPVLTLQETAMLLDVCPTTVRRYTNRGVLNCFRTPGNQRRFRLSDVIAFMEQRDTPD
ncbi:MAG: helix-turn-helix domain-containing protein [Armatimonadota bacterium]